MACECVSGIFKLDQVEGYYYNRYVIANNGTIATLTGRNAGGIINLTQFGNWRVPNNTDWGNLFTVLGGTSVAGGAMKSIPFWLPPNTGATNSSSLFVRGTGAISISGGGSIGQQGELSRHWSGGTGTPTTRTYICSYTSAGASSSNSANPRNLQSIRLCRELIECESDYDNFTYVENAYIGNDGIGYDAVKVGNFMWLACNLAETKYNNGNDIYAPTDNADWLAQPTTIGILSKGNNFQDTGQPFEVTAEVNDCTDDPCQCLKLDWESASGSFPTENYNLETLGLINGRNYYEFDTPTYPNTLRLSWRTQTEPVGFPATPYWTISDKTNADQILAILERDSLCPEGTNAQWNGFGSLLVGTESAECGCGVKEERIEKSYGSIKLPDNFQETPRGDKSCCCEYLVLGMLVMKAGNRILQAHG